MFISEKVRIFCQDFLSVFNSDLKFGDIIRNPTITSAQSLNLHL